MTKYFDNYFEIFSFLFFILQIYRVLIFFDLLKVFRKRKEADFSVFLMCNSMLEKVFKNTETQRTQSFTEGEITFFTGLVFSLKTYCHSEHPPLSF